MSVLEEMVQSNTFAFTNEIDRSYIKAQEIAYCDLLVAKDVEQQIMDKESR